jgi:ABC-type enterochelin transport system permease subunit
MNAVIISGFTVGLAGVIAQNAWYYWHRRRLQVLAGVLTAVAVGLLDWGAHMAHRDIFPLLILAAAISSVAGSLAFVAFMAEVKHQGWAAVSKRMSGRERKS